MYVDFASVRGRPAEKRSEQACRAARPRAELTIGTTNCQKPARQHKSRISSTAVFFNYSLCVVTVRSISAVTEWPLLADQSPWEDWPAAPRTAAIEKSPMFRELLQPKLVSRPNQRLMRQTEKCPLQTFLLTDFTAHVG